MKKMKKLLAGFMAATMVMSMSVTAFADEQEQDWASKLNKGTEFTKEYEIKHGTAPSEIFDFKVEFESYEDNEGNTPTTQPTTYPTVTLGDAEFSNNLNATDEAKVSVDISNYSEVALGKYTYKITEIAPTSGNKTAGTTYEAEPVYLVVTILNNETKSNHYVAAIHYEKADGVKTGKTTNTYDAGQLSVKKLIEGNMADMDKKFEFTVTFTPEDGTVFNTDVQIVNDSDTTSRKYTSETKDGVVTIKFELGHNETATFTNIPKGTTYTVSEDAGNYTSTHTTEADGSIVGGDEDSDVWTNTLTSEVDTGISLDNMPYIMVLAMVALGLVGFVSKKRSMEF